MAQGKSKKPKVKIPSEAQKPKSTRKKAVGPKKGGGSIAPKKAKAVANQKLKKMFDKQMTAAIEEQCSSMATNSESKSLSIVNNAGKKRAAKTSAKGNSSA